MSTKTCPFCAEEIAEAAIVCRWCGRPYLIGAVRLKYLGAALALGDAVLVDGTPNYAIWNLASGGQPLETFPTDDKQWKLAWTRFQAGERQAAKTGAGGWAVGVAIPLDWAGS